MRVCEQHCVFVCEMCVAYPAQTISHEGGVALHEAEVGELYYFPKFLFKIPDTKRRLPIRRCCCYLKLNLNTISNFMHINKKVLLSHSYIL